MSQRSIPRTLLVLNAGSSSMKFGLFTMNGEEPKAVARGQVEGLGTVPRFEARDRIGRSIGLRDWPASATVDHPEALDCITEFVRHLPEGHRIDAVGHRVVHGARDFTDPVIVDADVLEKLEALVPLAPLHQPHNIRAIRAIAKRFPEMPQVACFDTAFHATRSEVEQAYAIPRAMSERGVRRYGFHGLSYEYVVRTLHHTLPALAHGRVVVAHLGNGASMCAMRDGRSVATTMGFTAMGGLPMGTRCGDIDPGVILYLMNHLGMSGTAVERMLNRESGLLGVSGVSSDMRTLLASTDPRANFAVDLFVHRIGRELGSLAAALGGLDTLVFTGGIGEHSPTIRARVCQAAAWLGVAIDDQANVDDSRCISKRTSAVSAWVIPTDEELVIARHTARMTMAQLEAVR